MRLHNVCISVGKKIGLSTSQLTDLKLLAKIHDIGKLGIPDSILFKKGKLNKYEWEIMQTHTIIGFNIVKQFPLLNNIAYLILMHHERWDGFGYPLGLKEENVPIECRILSIIDAFDAMTNDRPYRSAMDSNEAINEIEKGTGTQFDPDIAKTFLKLVN